MRYLTEQDEAKRKEAFKQMDRFRQIEDAVYDHLVSLKIDMKNLYEHKDCLYVRGWGKDTENPRMGIPTTGKRIMTLKQYDELINKIKLQIDGTEQN